MIIKFHKQFQKTFQKLPSKIRGSFSNRLKVFMADPFNPVLKNHGVDVAYPNWRSINITGDYRALYEIKNDSTVIFMKIGTHAGLYR